MSNKIRTMSIRIISLISSLVILVSCFVLPAAATDTSDVTSAYQPTFINLFDYDFQFTREILSNGSVVSSEVTNDPAINYNGSFDTVRLVWGNSEDKFSCDYLYITVVSDLRPDSVTFGNSNINGSLVGVSADNYIYKFSLQGSYSAVFRVTITMDSAFRGQVYLGAAFAVIDNSSSISEVNFSSKGLLRSDGQYYMQEFVNKAVTLPYSYEERFTSDNPSVCPEQFFVDINFPVSVPYADSVSITFFSSNIWPNYYDQDTLSQGGVALLKNGSTQEILPYIVSDSITSSSRYGQPMYIYTITVDLSGLELDNNSFLHFRMYLGRMYENATSSNTANFYYLSILSCSIKNVSYTKPWYVRFFYWIQDEFTSLKDTIKSAFGVDQTAPDTSEKESVWKDQIEENQQANDELNDVIGQLETAPTVPDFGDTGLEDFDAEVYDSNSSTQPVFVVIFENPVIYQMVTYVFMFALGGFLLYGER